MERGKIILSPFLSPTVNKQWGKASEHTRSARHPFLRLDCLQPATSLSAYRLSDWNRFQSRKHRLHRARKHHQHRCHLLDTMTKSSLRDATRIYNTRWNRRRWAYLYARIWITLSLFFWVICGIFAVKYSNLTNTAICVRPRYDFVCVVREAKG